MINKIARNQIKGSSHKQDNDDKLCQDKFGEKGNHLGSARYPARAYCASTGRVKPIRTRVVATADLQTLGRGAGFSVSKVNRCGLRLTQRNKKYNSKTQRPTFLLDTRSTNGRISRATRVNLGATTTPNRTAGKVFRARGGKAAAAAGTSKALVRTRVIATAVLQTSKQRPTFLRSGGDDNGKVF